MNVKKISEFKLIVEVEQISSQKLQISNWLIQVLLLRGAQRGVVPPPIPISWENFAHTRWNAATVLL